MKRIYLDYAASTPVDPEVEAAMRPYFLEKFGNPGSLHSFGQEAIAALDRSREVIAKAIGAGFNEVIFTGSATEANNLAVRGVYGAWQTVHGEKARPRIITSTIEHESVLETARGLENEGVEVVYLSVDRHGIVDLEKLKSSLNDRTALVSIMYANNEIGTIQPITEVAKAIRDFRESHKSLVTGYQLPLFHIDAVQAFQFFDCNVNALGVDLMTLSAHKIYGPKGIGALYVRNLKPKTYNLKPIVTGGGQEFGLRSGTENVPLAVGFAKAAELVSNSRELESKRIEGLCDYFWSGFKKIYPRAEINGCIVHSSLIMERTERKSSMNHAPCSMLPNILNVYFPSHLSEDLLMKFDLAGLAVSAGSACRSRAVESSYVIEALGFSKDRAERSIRVSFGRPTSREEVKRALAIMKLCLNP